MWSIYPHYQWCILLAHKSNLVKLVLIICTFLITFTKYIFIWPKLPILFLKKWADIWAVVRKQNGVTQVLTLYWSEKKCDVNWNKKSVHTFKNILTTIKFHTFGFQAYTCTIQIMCIFQISVIFKENITHIKFLEKSKVSLLHY